MAWTSSGTVAYSHLVMGPTLAARTGAEATASGSAPGSLRPDVPAASGQALGQPPAGRSGRIRPGTRAASGQTLRPPPTSPVATSDQPADQFRPRAGPRPAR
ncbi:hypothetical protein GCM10009535_28160 [Streptomyces thermocarboxydovorans]|uniref:Uncharacterized protein n=1 Tax=Streptomyces thermocarboxydovorans TaxID=59298 RepID=A0ABP3SS13_9ACTN